MEPTRPRFWVCFPSKVNSRGRKNKVSIARNSTASPKGHLPRLSRISRWAAHRSSLLGKGSPDGTRLKLVPGGKGLGERKHHTGGNEPLMGQRGSAGGFADVTAMSASGSLPTSHVLLLCSQLAWTGRGSSKHRKKEWSILLVALDGFSFFLPLWG